MQAQLTRPPRSVALDWKRLRPGWYEATDPEGDHWRIVQSASARWTLLISAGSGYTEVEESVTLAEAKATAEEVVAESMYPKRATINAERRARQRRRRRLRATVESNQ